MGGEVGHHVPGIDLGIAADVPLDFGMGVAAAQARQGVSKPLVGTEHGTGDHGVIAHEVRVITSYSIHYTKLYDDRQFIAPRFPAPAPAVQPAQEEGPAETASPGAAIPAMQAATAPDGALEEPEPVIDVVEVLHPLENGKVRIELTSLGGGIKSATLLGYPELVV